VRRWAKEYSDLYIVTGPVLKAGLPTIGPNKVAVPEYYYKVILHHNGPESKAIAFLMANEGSREALQSFAVSVDSVEKVTGIDFFPNLPREEENRVEKTVCLPCWTWSNQKIRKSSASSSGYLAGSGFGGHSSLLPAKSRTHKLRKSRSTSSGSLQCGGVTKKGNQCARKTRSSNGFCWQHSK